MRKHDDTVAIPSAVPSVRRPLRRTLAVDATLPATAPAQSPAATSEPAKSSGSSTRSRASSTVMPRCLRRLEEGSAANALAGAGPRSGRTSLDAGRASRPVLRGARRAPGGTGPPTTRMRRRLDHARVAATRAGTIRLAQAPRLLAQLEDHVGRQAHGPSSGVAASTSSGTSSSSRSSASPCVLPCASVLSREAEPPPPRLSDEEEVQHAHVVRLVPHHVAERSSPAMCARTTLGRSAPP